MKATRLLAATALLFFNSMSAAFAVGTLISAPEARDMVHDFARDRVYITTPGAVLRYDLATGTFLTPFSLGGTWLMGIDISANGRYLAVAESARTETEVWIHVVDLETGAFRKIIAPRAFYEGGTFTVAFGATGWILVSSTFEGSGWTPLRRIHPETGAIVVLPEVRQSTMLKASGDRTRLGYAEANISDGRWGRYTFADDLMERREWYENGTSSFNWEIATNRDGSQIAIPAGYGTYVYNDAFAKVATVGGPDIGYALGVAYHPVENRLYMPWSGAGHNVKVFETNTFTEVASYPFENELLGGAFGGARTKLSIDGSLLMVAVAGGVRIHRAYAALDAADMTVATGVDMPTTFALAGGIGNGATPTYSIIQVPAHGQAVLNGAQVTYTPAAGYRGNDALVYRVVYGLAAVEAQVAIDVSQSPPVARNLQYTLAEDSARPVAIRLQATDAEGDPLTYAIVSAPQHGALTGSGAAWAYKPALNFSGVDTFTYQARDPTSSSNLATVTLTVTPVNDPPVANPDVATVARRGVVTIPVLANDSDHDGDTLTIASVTKPSVGTAKVSNGAIVYTAGASAGTAKFNYTISDGHGRTATAMVTVTIQR